MTRIAICTSGVWFFNFIARVGIIGVDRLRIATAAHVNLNVAIDIITSNIIVVTWSWSIRPSWFHILKQSSK